MRSSFSLVLAGSGRAVARSGHRGRQVPTQDIANARDNPLLRRYDGSFIVDYAQRAFDEFELPTGAEAGARQERRDEQPPSSRRTAPKPSKDD